MAELFTWDLNRFTVNVSKCDMQHKKLVDIINKLYDAMKTGKAGDYLGEIVTELVDYTKTHFSDEEVILAKHNYPELPQQKEAHKRFVDKLVEIKSKLSGGTSVVTIETMNFLKDWLTNHILKEDKKYGVFLKDRNLV